MPLRDLLTDVFTPLIELPPLLSGPSPKAGPSRLFVLHIRQIVMLQ